MKFVIGVLLICFAVVTSCQTPDPCIDQDKINEEAPCTRDYRPVCGCDGKTYSNQCGAENAGLLSWTEGPCEN